MNARRWLLALLLAGTVLWWCWPRPEPVSVEAGAEWFHRRDLGTARLAGMPHALFLALVELHPDELGGDLAGFCQLFGTFLDPDGAHGLPVGFVLERDSVSGSDLVSTTCALCHSALLEGRRVDGLGNRQLRMNALENTLQRVLASDRFTTAELVRATERAAVGRRLSWTWRSALVVEESVRKLRRSASFELNRPEGGSVAIDAGPGRNAPIEFARLASNVPLSQPFGYTKIPAVWTYRQRKTFGVDGSLEGELAIAAVEFNKGMSAADILSRRGRWSSLAEYLRSLRPPAFPDPVDAGLSEQGRIIFRDNCAYCHGMEDSYEETVVPLSRIGTDAARLRAVVPELVQVRNANALAEHIKPRLRDGYVPPPLDGIWCRGPFLHNGSVPTIEDLLRPVEERPVWFPVGNVDYSREKLGLCYEEETTSKGMRAGKITSTGQPILDTRLPGNSNAGHTFGTRLPSRDRRALLEYLKTR